MKDFTMSMYRSKEDLYKAKAEYYEEKLKFAVELLAKTQMACEQAGLVGSILYDQIEEFIGEVGEE